MFGMCCCTVVLIALEPLYSFDGVCTSTFLLKVQLQLLDSDTITGFVTTCNHSARLSTVVGVQESTEAGIPGNLRGPDD